MCTCTGVFEPPCVARTQCRLSRFKPSQTIGLCTIHSSLISSVNASLWLIENELVYVSLQCLYKAVKETHTHTHTNTLSDAGQTSEPSYYMQRIACACDKSINPLVQRHYTRRSSGTFIPCRKREQLINQEYVEIKPHIKPVQSARLQWQWFTAGWAKLLTVRSCNGCQRLLLISVAGDTYCRCYFLPRRFHWCLPRYPTVPYLNHMGAKWCN